MHVATPPTLNRYQRGDNAKGPKGKSDHPQGKVPLVINMFDFMYEERSSSSAPQAKPARSNKLKPHAQGAGGESPISEVEPDRNDGFTPLLLEPPNTPAEGSAPPANNEKSYQLLVKESTGNVDSKPDPVALCPLGSRQTAQEAVMQMETWALVIERESSLQLVVESVQALEVAFEKLVNEKLGAAKYQVKFLPVPTEVANRLAVLRRAIASEQKRLSRLLADLQGMTLRCAEAILHWEKSQLSSDDEKPSRPLFDDYMAKMATDAPSAFGSDSSCVEMWLGGGDLTENPLFLVKPRGRDVLSDIRARHETMMAKVKLQQEAHQIHRKGVFLGRSTTQSSHLQTQLAAMQARRLELEVNGAAEEKRENKGRGRSEYIVRTTEKDSPQKETPLLHFEREARIPECPDFVILPAPPASEEESWWSRVVVVERAILNARYGDVKNESTTSSTPSEVHPKASRRGQGLLRPRLPKRAHAQNGDARARTLQLSQEAVGIAPLKRLDWKEELALQAKRCAESASSLATDRVDKMVAEINARKTRAEESRVQEAQQFVDMVCEKAVHIVYLSSGIQFTVSATASSAISNAIWNIGSIVRLRAINREITSPSAAMFASPVVVMPSSTEGMKSPLQLDRVRLVVERARLTLGLKGLMENAQKEVVDRSSSSKPTTKDAIDHSRRLPSRPRGEPASSKSRTAPKTARRFVDPGMLGAGPVSVERGGVL